MCGRYYNITTPQIPCRLLELNPSYLSNTLLCAPLLERRECCKPNNWSVDPQVDMITEMDNLVNPGSDLLIAAALPEAEMQRRLYAGGIMTSPCVRKGCFACKGKPVATSAQSCFYPKMIFPEPGSQSDHLMNAARQESAQGKQTCSRKQDEEGLENLVNLESVPKST